VVDWVHIMEMHFKAHPTRWAVTIPILSEIDFVQFLYILSP
jgi:hypothetical protein